MCTSFVIFYLQFPAFSIHIIFCITLGHYNKIHCHSSPSNSKHEPTKCMSNITTVAALLLTPHHYLSWMSLKLHIKCCTLDDKIVACPRQACMAMHLLLLFPISSGSLWHVGRVHCCTSLFIILLPHPSWVKCTIYKPEIFFVFPFMAMYSTYSRLAHIHTRMYSSTYTHSKYESLFLISSPHWFLVQHDFVSFTCSLQWPYQNVCYIQDVNFEEVAKKPQNYPYVAAVVRTKQFFSCKKGCARKYIFLYWSSLCSHWCLFHL